MKSLTELKFKKKVDDGGYEEFELHYNLEEYCIVMEMLYPGIIQKYFHIQRMNAYGEIKNHFKTIEYIPHAN